MSRFLVGVVVMMVAASIGYGVYQYRSAPTGPSVEAQVDVVVGKCAVGQEMHVSLVVVNGMSHPVRVLGHAGC